MFLFRQVKQEDFKDLKELAHHLGAVGNLASDEKKLHSQIETAQKSFADPSFEKTKAIYLFVLEDLKNKKVVGSSLIFAKHGTPQSPHTYLKVFEKTHRDESTNTEVRHQLLRFEFDEDGPSEIGGLILHPNYRRNPLAPGKQLSYSRLIYMGLQAQRFEEKVIAELLPPFYDDGSSPLWEAFGRRFTNMSYQEADQLSRTNKDFIKALFPDEDIYTNLFSPRARDVIGKTGPESKSAKRLLEKIGFRYLQAVDPFDGGPHYGAKISELSIVSNLKKISLRSGEELKEKKKGIFAFEAKNQFFTICTSYQETGAHAQVEPETFELISSLGADVDMIFLSGLE